MLLLAGCTLTAQGQQASSIQRESLQRLLSAEDARGTGEEGVAPMMAGLVSRDTLIRRVATRGIGRLQRPGSVPLLVKLLSDPVSQIRAEAAIAISQSLGAVKRGEAADSTQAKVAEALQALSAAIRKERNDSVAGVIAEAIGRLPLGDSSGGRSAERAIFDRGNRAVNVGFAHGLYWLALARRYTGGLSSESVTLLRRAALSARDTTVRRMSVLALASAKALDSATVHAASRDRDAQVRRLALAGVAVLDPAARSALIRRAVSDPSPIVRIDAVRAARAGSDRPDCALIVRAASDTNAYVALAAIDALGSPCADSVASAAALKEVIDRPQTEVGGPPDHAWQRAAHALVALSRVDSAHTGELLHRFAGSPRWGNRVYAASAAANLADISGLLRLAADSDDNVREAAITGLARTRGHGADSVYLAALNSRGNQVVLAAATVLAGSHDSMAVTSLLDAFDRISARRSENARDPRLAILARIDEMGSAANSTRLASYVSDFDTTVAMNAAAILSKWTGARVEARPSPLPLPPEPLAALFLTRDIRLKVTMAASSGGGSFTLRLFSAEAPATVARIVRLARSHYYDGHILQRVEPNFVIQGGGPGASEYVGDSTFMRDELAFHSHFRGTAGISSRGRDTGDAQLFLNLVDNPRLDHEYTVLGQVIEGMSVVDQILEGDVIARAEVTGAP
jgi:cyclophilin family peptidyl-prolyl cis-trans isomerase/HEAT repeat protein